MNLTTTSSVPVYKNFLFICIFCMISLYASIVVWEWFAASNISLFLLIKITVLLPILFVAYRRHPYHLQWSSMLILVYFLDGTTNFFASFKEFASIQQSYQAMFLDWHGPGNHLAWGTWTAFYFSRAVPFFILLFSTIFFVQCIATLAPLKKAQKQQKKHRSS